jgi:hypothetical protein
MSINFLTIGNDCSPAAALRQLNLREFALPFDWIVSNITILEKCFKTNFINFHTNLVLNHTKTRLIDYYGFQYPHDYPICHATDFDHNIGEGVFAEETGKYIADTWPNYYNNVLDKYTRRIERFKHIINDTKPIIVLCRYGTSDVLKLQQLFIKYYNVKNMYFINSSSERFESDTIKNVYTEKNNIWNDVTIWKTAIDITIQKINANK